MKEGVGTAFNLSLLFYFMLLVAGFALFGINYYRAFRVKNHIITYIEQFEGNFNNNTFKNNRLDMINASGYNIDQSKLDIARTDGWTCPDQEGWCYKLNSDIYKNGNHYCIYEVKAFISTDIPVINKLFANYSFFEVNGVTKQIRRKAKCN